MKKRKGIEARIATLDVEIQKCESVLEENHRAYDEAEKKLETDLLSLLKEASFPVDERTRLDVRFYGFASPENKKISVTFQSGDRMEFTVDFLHRKTAEVRSCGISSSCGQDKLLQIEAYHKMVAAVLDKLTSKYFDTKMALFFDTLESFTYPEMKEVPGYSALKDEKTMLERELKVLDLDLEIGKKVEVYIEGKSRRYRSRFIEMSVIKMTEKTITFESDSYGIKVIKREDVLGKIRMATQEATA
jgi:hypothetical protein